MSDSTSAHCPTVDQLGAYCVGRLGDAELQRIALHVETCSSCEETLVAITAQEDTLVSGLRNLAAVKDESADAVLERAVQRILEPDAIPSPVASGRRTIDSGTVLRDYQVLEKLGQGGMGTVYRALHTKLDREVALKILPTERLGDNQSIARFTREMKAVGKLDHPNIVRAFDAGEAEGIHYLAMELVRGIDLGQLVKSNGPLPIPEACEIIRQAALGLQHAHEHGFVHRDIKPSNLMLAAGSKGSAAGNRETEPLHPGAASWLRPTASSPVAIVKLLDLGLARFEESPTVEERELTDTGQLMGTADYMAPEQWLDTHRVDIRADIYALGCTLYYLLAGQPPFGVAQWDTVGKKMMAHAQSPVPPIRGRRPDVLAGLVGILDRMLAKDPAARFATPIDVAAALEPLAACADLGQLRVKPGHRSKLDRGPSRQEACPSPLGRKAIPLVESQPLEREAIPQVVASPLAGEGQGEGAAKPWFSRFVSTRKLLTIAALMLVALTPLTYFFGGQVVRLVTNKGQVVIELDDPLIEVTVKEGGAMLVDRKGSRTITLAAGEHQLDVEINSDGEVARFRTHKFTLTRGGKVIVNVRQELAKAERRSGESDASSDTATKSDENSELLDADPDRRAAEYVLSIGGLIGVRFNEESREIRALRDLPEEPFRLTSVHLQNNPHVTDIGLSSFKHCRNVTQLTLYGTDVTDAGLAYFKDCKNLARLDLFGARRVTDAGLVHFKACKDLTYIDLTDTQVSDAGLAYLQDCTNLMHLTLCSPFTAAGLVNFKDRENLTYLELSGRQVNDASLANFKDCEKLEVLYLYGTDVTDAGLAHFKDCKNLTRLLLPSDHRIGAVTDLGLAHFKGCNLTELELAGTQVSDAGLAQFGDCKNMVRLSLAFTNATDAGLAHFRDCKNLVVLNLGGTQAVTDAGLAHFKDCKNFTYVVLHDTSVTDAGLAYVKDSKNLAYLDLHATRVSDGGLDVLLSLPNLASLNVQNCRISRYGYEQLRAALLNCKIEWSEPNRTAGEQVLALGGTVEIGAPRNNDSQTLTTRETLPNTFFQVRRIVLKDVKQPLGDLPKTLARLTYSETDRLESVDFSGTPLPDYRFLAPIHGLRELTLARAGVTYDHLTKFPKLPQLRRLVLDDNPISGPGMAFLQQQPELTDLSLNCGTITDFALKNLSGLTRLERLSLVGANLTDAGLTHLERLTNLETLDLRKTKVTAEGIERLQRTLPDCRIEWDHDK